MSTHQKHTKLPLRNNDFMTPNEIAFLGTKCEVVSNLVEKIAIKLKSYKLAYVDASHQKQQINANVENFTFHENGNLFSNTKNPLNKFNQRIQFSDFDMTFINGNHFKASKQILILDKEKAQSLLKRIDQLTHVQFVIKLSDDEEFFDFLIEKYPQITHLNCYSIKDVQSIAKHIENLILAKIPPINGLVLAGGKSTRMGKDKGLLEYTNKPQRNVGVELLQKNNLKTFLSVRNEQEVNIDLKIVDTFLELGPFGAICSAFQSNPNVAYFVLATDLPFVNDTLVKLLLKHRDPSKIATAVKGKNKEFPEPLIAIWEPKSYPHLLSFLSQGYSCPRKVLINSDVKIIEVEDDLLRNINTPEEFEQAKNEIND